jgi:uncharacterized protein
LQIEFRGNDSVFISGYINAVERESHFIPLPNGKKFKEVIKQGVFERALKRAKDVLLLFNHDEDKQLGSIQQGNLKLYEDSIGLKAETEIRDAAFIEKARQPGFLNGWSFGFQDIKSTFEFEKKEGYEKRFIEDLDLFEVSILGGFSKPCYPACSVEVRNQDILERRYSEFETEIQESNVDFSIREQTLNYLKLKGMYL